MMNALAGLIDNIRSPLLEPAALGKNHRGIDTYLEEGEAFEDVQPLIVGAPDGEDDSDGIVIRDGKRVCKVELRIGGMTVCVTFDSSPFCSDPHVASLLQCGACVAAIENNLKEQAGIHSVQIALLAERGIVEYEADFVGEDGSKWDSAKIAEEIEDCGFEAEVVERGSSQELNLRVYGCVIIYIRN